MAAPAIGIRPRWAPRQSIVDPTHPLSQGLWFHRSSSQPGRATGSISWATSPYGRCVQSGDNNASVYAVPIPAAPTMFDITMHTVKAMSSLDPWAISVGVPYDPQNAGWSSPYWAVSMEKYDTNDVARFHVNNAGTQIDTPFSTTGYWLSDSVFHSYTGSWGTQGRIAYRDGVVWESSGTQINGSSSFTPTIVGTPEVVFCGRSASTPGEGFTGQHALAIVWARRLSDLEVAMVHADPFCFMVR